MGAFQSHICGVTVVPQIIAEPSVLFNTFAEISALGPWKKLQDLHVSVENYATNRAARRLINRQMKVRPNGLHQKKSPGRSIYELTGHGMYSILSGQKGIAGGLS